MVMRQYETPLVAEKREIPVPGPGEALVRVAACGVCARTSKGTRESLPRSNRRVFSDMKSPAKSSLSAMVIRQDARRTAGVHLSVSRLRDGCTYCTSDRENMCTNPGPRIGFERDGGFAEYVVCAADNVLTLPAGIESAAAAILCDAAATAARATARAHLRSGANRCDSGRRRTRLVRSSARRPRRRECYRRGYQRRTARARPRAGLIEIVNLRSSSLPKGLDAAIDFAGVAQTATAGFEALASDGILIVTGYDPDASFPVATQTLARSQRWIAGSRGSTRGDLRMVIDLVANGKLRAAIGDRFSLSAKPTKR